MAQKIMKGKFITFEGPEGSGKSTHARLIYNYLKKKGYPVIYIHDPGTTVIGEKIREILLSKAYKEMSDITELLLYEAARAQLMKEKIIPSLKEGKIIICDRFQESTVAYQGYGSGLNLAMIKRIGDYVTGGIKPDLTIILDISTKKGLKRAGRVKDRIEKKSLNFHQRVRRGYRILAQRNPKQIKIISGDKEINFTQRIIRKIVERCLLER